MSLLVPDAGNAFCFLAETVLASDCKSRPTGQVVPNPIGLLGRSFLRVLPGFGHTGALGIGVGIIAKGAAAAGPAVALEWAAALSALTQRTRGGEVASPHQPYSSVGNDRGGANGPTHAH